MKIKNYIIVLIVAVSLLGLNLSQAKADRFGINKLGHEVQNWQNQASKTADLKGKRLVNIISRGDQMITSRLTSLNNLDARINADVKLQSGEKGALVSDIQTEISGLTALKIKLDADTDLTTAVSDEKQIITGYYIYAITEPKIRLLIILSNLQSVSLYLQALIPQLQNLITTLQVQGKDVSGLQPLLADINSQIQAINTALSTDINNLNAVSISSSQTQAKTVFTQTRSDISQIVRADFLKIKSDINQMRLILKQIIFSKNTHPSINPSVNQTSTPPAVTN